MDALSPIFEAMPDLLHRACGGRDARSKGWRSITLLTVALVLACAGAYALGTGSGHLALLIPAAGTFAAGLAGGVPFPFPWTAGLVATGFAFLGAMPVAFSTTFLG